MGLEELVISYGIVAVFVGAAVEGETAVFFGGLLSHRGMFPYWEAALAASAGSFIADQTLFFLGRHSSGLQMIQRVSARPAMKRVTSFLEEYPNAFVFFFRFIYGMRTVSPVAIGLSSISAMRFLVVNLISAAIWGTVITAIGFFSGSAIHRLLGRISVEYHIAIALIPAVILISMLIVGARWLAKKNDGDSAT